MAGQYQDDAPYWGYQDETIWQDFADWLYERGLLEGGGIRWSSSLHQRISSAITALK